MDRDQEKVVGMTDKEQDHTVSVHSSGIQSPTSENTAIPIVNDPGSGEIYKVYKRRWIGILSLALLNFTTSWGWLSFSAISDYVAEFFNMQSQTAINWLSTVIMFAYVVISPVVSWVLHKYGVKTSLIVGGLLSVLGNWIRYAGTNRNLFGLVMFGQILIGFAQPFALSASTYYTDMWFTSRSRVTANAIASLANPLGGLVAQLVGPAMVVQPDQLPMFILVTAIVSTGCAAVALIVPSRPRYPPCASSTIVKLPLKDSLIALFRNPNYVILFITFSVYVGFFNAFSTYIGQIMVPYGYSPTNAGITGAILIAAGIIAAAILSPIIDRTHAFGLLIRVQVPIITGCYIALIFVFTKSLQLVGPFLVSGILGAVSFSLLPVLLEWVQEQTSPVSPAVSANALWIGGQILGAVFIIIMNALKYGPESGDPPQNMRKALIFEAAVAGAAALPLLFLRTKDNVRVHLDRRV